MTNENKKVLYGAARRNKIKKTMNDVETECLALMKLPVISVTLVAADGTEVVTTRPTRLVVVEKIATALDTVAKLEAGQPV